MTGARWAPLFWWTLAFLIVWGTLYWLVTRGECGMGPAGGICDAIHRNSWRPFLVVGTVLFTLIVWWKFPRKR